MKKKITSKFRDEKQKQKKNQYVTNIKRFFDIR